MGQNSTMTKLYEEKFAQVTLLHKSEKKKIN